MNSVAVQRRHGILAPARALKDIAARIDFALDVAGLPGDAHFPFDDVVVRLQLVVGDRPIFQRRSLGMELAPYRLIDSERVLKSHGFSRQLCAQ